MQVDKETQTNPTSEYISRKELAARLNLTTQSLLILDRQGVIPSYRVGGSVRYSWSEVQNKISQTRGYVPRANKGGKK
jgi:hypothetical protein